MKSRSGIGALERRLRVERINKADPAWVQSVREYVTGCMSGAPADRVPDPPDSTITSDDWRDVLQARACGRCWLERSLPLTEYLPGMTSGAVAIARVISRSRWEWWTRARQLPCYANDPKPWFVPDVEPIVPDPLPRAAELLPELCEVLGLSFVRGAEEDTLSLMRWLCGGVNPLPGVEYPSTYPCSKEPGGDFPETLPEGQTAPGWFF